MDEVLQYHRIDNPSYTTHLVEKRNKLSCCVSFIFAFLYRNRIRFVVIKQGGKAAPACLQFYMCAANVIKTWVDQPCTFPTLLIGEGPKWTVANFYTRAKHFPFYLFSFQYCPVGNRHFHFKFCREIKLNASFVCKSKV